jgi:hypothetical protein
MNVASQPSGTPVRYHKTQYGLMFFLPASWRGYTVLTERFDVSLYSTNYQNEIGREHLQIITLRHPQWLANDPHKDIPIMVYTHRQWHEEQQERLASHAGGTIIELWHNQRYVFGLPNRYYIIENDNHGKELRGVEEAADIIRQNRSAHKMPPLYPEK